MELKNYLKSKYTASTVASYEREIIRYLEENPNAATANYNDIINHIGIVRKRHKTAAVHRILQSIKKYYDYLQVAEIRTDHPCKSLNLNDKPSKQVQLQDLFDETELEQLLERKERYKILGNRNRVITGFLIYQGMQSSEITRLKLEDINLAEPTVHIGGTKRTNARTLQLKSKQILPLYKYLEQDRKQLITSETEQLILTKKGTEENGEGISYLIETQKYRFPNRRLNPKTIRQSVIANRLKEGVDLRKVQHFAGHKYPSSTERYRINNIDELKQGIKKYHPLQ